MCLKISRNLSISEFQTGGKLDNSFHKAGKMMVILVTANKE